MPSGLHSLFTIVAITILYQHENGKQQIIINPEFEQLIGSEWTCRGCVGYRITDSQVGNASFLATERASEWQGPEQVLQLGSATSGGRIYQFSGYVKVLPSLTDQQPQRLMANINYTLPDGEWQLLSIAYTDYIEPADGWVHMDAKFCTLELNQTELRIIIIFAETGVDFQVDTLSMVEVGVANDNSGILINPGFEKPIGGSGWRCIGVCTETLVNDSHTGNWAYKASGRDDYWQGPSQLMSLGQKATVESHIYKFSGYVKVLPMTSYQLPQNFTVFLYYRMLEEAIRIGYRDNVSPADGWVLIETEFYTWDILQRIDIFIGGPDPGVDFLADTLSLVDIGVTSIDPVGQVLRNSGFEKLIGGSGWFCYGRCGQVLVNDSHTGSNAYKVFNRSSYWHGPSQVMSSRISEDQPYRFRGYVKVLQSLTEQRPQMFRATMAYQTTGNIDRQFRITYSHNVQPADGWVLMEAEFRTPDDSKGLMRFTIDGPEAGIDFLVDTLSITRNG